MRRVVCFPLLRKQVFLSCLCLLLASSAATAQAPSTPDVVVDAQLALSLSASGAEARLSNPSGIAVGPDGVIYVADAANGRIVEIATQGAIEESPVSDPAKVTGTATYLAPPEGLSAPNAVAVSGDGTLYFSDQGRKALYRVTNPESASPIYTRLTYAAAQRPAALAVDEAGDLWVADARLQRIVEFGPAATTVTFSQSVQPLIPTGIAVSATSIYFTDAASNAVYGEGKREPLLTSVSGRGFNFAADHAAARPTGMGFDQAGNLFILDAFNRRLVEFHPGRHPRPEHDRSAFLVPFSGLDAPAGLGIGPTGNLYITDQATQTVNELVYGANSLNFGTVAGGANSSSAVLNYLFNTAASTTRFYQRMQGGRTARFAFDNQACLQADIQPGYTCQQKFHVNYKVASPGLHKGVVALSDRSGAVLGPMTSFGVSQSGIVAFYPAIVNTLSQASPYPALAEPQAVVVSGTGDHMFVADEGMQVSGNTYTYAGKVWDYPVANGAPTGAPTKISSATLTAPIAVALDAAGNLFIADYVKGAIFESPATNRSNITQLTIPSGGTLNHPIALAFDPSGNLYIGDTGPAGTLATAANPGYVVRVSPGFTSAVTLHYAVGTAPVIYPQGLTTDTSGNLYIADGGDGQSNPGNLVVVQAATGTVANIPTGSYTLSEPAGLVFDAALNLYVLDGYNSRLLVVPVTLSSGTPSFGTASQLQAFSIATGAAMAMWPQGQLTITDIGADPTSAATQVITLQTNTANLSFGPIPRGSTQSKTITAINIGNTTTTFASNPTETGDTPAFSIGTPICAGGIAPQQQCTLTFTYTPDLLGTTTAQFALKVNPATAPTNYVNLTGTSAKPTPTVVLSIAPANLTYPGGTNATVTVSGNFGMATGSAQIFDGTTLLTTVTLGYNGIGYAYINGGLLPAGTQTLTAVYSGDGTYATATSAPVQVVVAPEPVTLTLSCYSSNGGSYGGNYLCTAYTNVAATGNIVFTSDGVAYSVPINNSSASFTVTSPVPGNHTIVASYAQQGNFAAAAPVTQNYTITKAVTQTQVVPSSYYLTGTTLTLTANVLSYNPFVNTSAGTVLFTDSLNSAFSAQCAPVNGSCSITINAPANGFHIYTAAYQGTALYTASSGSTTVTVAH